MSDDQLLTATDMTRLGNWGRTTFWRHRKAGRIPPGIQLGKVTLWRWGDVKHLLAGRN